MKKKSFSGFSFTIDRPKGYVKTWPQPGGREKSFTYPVDYGYLPRHTGEDGEGLDFFVGDAEDGHLESFQKLKKNDDGKYVLDETKFLVGVTDQERETIYKLYGPEVWHRKRYQDMDELERDLPKFAVKKKARYVDDEKVAFDLGSIRRRISTIPGIVRDAVSGPAPTMLAPMTRRPAMNLAEHLDNWAHRPGASTSSMLDSMTQRAGQLGYHDVAKSRSLGEYRDALTGMGFTPNQIFPQRVESTLGALHPKARALQPEWHTTSKVGSVLARFGLHEKLADSFADHGRAAVYGFGSGALNGLVRPYRSLRYGVPVEMRYLMDRNFTPSTRTDAAAALAGIPTGVAALGYGVYRGGKAIRDKLSPKEDHEMTPKQAALARYGLDKVADIDKKITGEILMADIGKKTAGMKLALTPLALGAMGAGIGAGVGAVHGFRTDDPSQSVEHHVMRGARNALIGAGIGTGVGVGGSALLNKAAPELVELSRKGPFPNIDPKHPHAPYHQLAQNLYDAWLNPVTRLGMGAYAGKNLAQSYGNMVDDWRLQQYAAQKGKTDAPETPNAAHLEAIRARRHMGAYSSSLDRGNG